MDNLDSCFEREFTETSRQQVGERKLTITNTVDGLQFSTQNCCQMAHICIKDQAAPIVALLEIAELSQGDLDTIIKAASKRQQGLPVDVVGRVKDAVPAFPAQDGNGCIRCGKALASDEDVQTGICPDCWTTADGEV